VLPVVVVMVLILVLAGLVVVYVAYPHRGEEVPAAPWLGEAMARAVGAAPTIAPEAHDPDERSRFHDSL
jgi:Na+/glutamate symporter